MAIDFTPDQNEYENLSPFKKWLKYQINTWGFNNFPFLENDFDQLTEYGMMMKLMKAVDTVIHNQNLVEEDMSKLYTAYTELQTYIDNAINEFETSVNNEVQSLEDYMNNYFNNLDVQEEINNKLNEMLEDGTLEHLIASYLQTQKIYDTTDEMIADASSLVDGLSVQTLGYHSLNDEGGAFFKITDTASTDEFQIDLGNNLYATLIIGGNTLNVKQFGAYGDNTHDDSLAFKNAIAFIDGKYMNLYINEGTYLITEPLYIDWQNSNFWQTFDGSYSIKGAGIYQSILNFTSSNGLIINRNTNILSIEISDFSIQNTSFVPIEQSGNERKPDDSKGIGLLVKHMGYTGHVSRIGVRGFYIGIATRNCYGGPILDNCFTYDTIFGYSSKSDTTVQHNSCSYMGIESCYIQEYSRATLTNIICEGSIHSFKTNTENQRSKFMGRGFSVYGGGINLFSCYSEALFGNARYYEDAYVVENNCVTNNNVGWLITQSGWEDLASWVSTNNWNYDEVYIELSATYKGSFRFINPYMEAGTAYIHDTAPNTSVKVDSDGKYVAPNVIFDGVAVKQGSANTFNLLSHGNAKPIVYLIGTYETYQENYSKIPQDLYGLVSTKNVISPSNWNGADSLNMSRIGNYTDTTYDEVSLKIRHTLDGAIRIFKETKLNGTSVNNTPVIVIAPDGKVSFPQNT